MFSCCPYSVSTFKVWALHIPSRSDFFFNPKARSHYRKPCFCGIAWCSPYFKRISGVVSYFLPSWALLRRKQPICSSFVSPERCLVLLSLLKPVAAWSLGHPETGEMFVVSNRVAGDATCLDTDSEFVLCKAIGKCCLPYFCLCCSKSHEDVQS